MQVSATNNKASILKGNLADNELNALPLVAEEANTISAWPANATESPLRNGSFPAEHCSRSAYIGLTLDRHGHLRLRQNIQFTCRTLGVVA